MALNSLQFIIAFSAFFLFYLLLDSILKRSGKSAARKTQTVALLIFSYFFILTFDWRFCICILCITLYTYVLARFIDRSLNGNMKRFLAVLAVLGLVAVLGAGSISAARMRWAERSEMLSPRAQAEAASSAASSMPERLSTKSPPSEQPTASHRGCEASR